MSIFVKDTFTDTAGTALVSHTGNTGATWTKTSYSNATNQILIGSGAECYGSATAGEGVWYASGNPTGRDYSVQADFQNKSAIGGQDMSILGRVAQGANAFYYAARWNEANGNVELFKNVNGVFTTLGSGTGIGLGVGHYVTIRLSMLASTIQLWGSIDGGSWILYYSVTDTSIFSGQAGIRSVQAGTTTTGTHLANFIAYNDSYWVGGTGSWSQPTVVNDTFTDTAGINLSAHTSNTGATWSLHPTTPTGSILESNANRIMGNLNGDSLYLSSAIPPTANYTVNCDIFCVTNVASSNHFVGRCSPSAKTFYMVKYDGTNIQMFKCIAGTYTQLGSNAGGVLTPGTAYPLQLVMTGSTISVQQGGTVLITATDSSITAAGQAGVLLSNLTTNTTGFHLDNFKVIPNNWAGSSGGPPSTTYAPSTTDNVIFDANSGTTPIVSMDTTATVKTFTAGNGISLADHENAAKGITLQWPGNNPITVAGDLTLNGDVQTNGTAGQGGFIMNTTSNYTQYGDSMVPYLGINGSSITVTCNAGTPGGAGVWYQTNNNINYLDILQGTFKFAYYEFGSFPQQNPISNIDVLTVSNSTSTRGIDFSGSIPSQFGTYLNIGKTFDASVTTGLTFSNMGTTQIHFNNNSNYTYDSFVGSSLQELSTHIADTNTTWAKVIGGSTMVISSNSRVYNSSATECEYGSSPKMYTEDVTIEGDLYVASNNGGYMGLVGRSFLTSDYGYLFCYDGSGTPHWQLTVIVNGTPTSLVSTNTTLNVGQTYHMKLQMVGNLITCFVDGVQVLQTANTATSGFYTMYTYAGIRGGTVAATDTTGYHLDNFSVNRVQPYTSPLTFNGGGQTYYAVSLDNAGKLTVTGNNTMAKLTTVAGSVCTLSGSNTITAWTVNPGTSWILGSGQTQTGTFTSTLQGTNNNNISFIASTPGSQAFINVGGSYMTVYMISFTDIMVTGGGRIVDYRGFDGGDNTNIIFMNGVVKYYTYDVYKPISRSTSTTVNPPVFVGQYSDVVTDPQFSQQINNPGGQMTIQRGVDPTNFGEGTLVDYNNYVVVKAFTEDYPNGVTIFLGFISSYTPNIEAGNQYVEVILLAYGAEFSQYLTIADPVVDVQNGSDPSVYPAHQQSDSAVYLSQKFTTGGGVTNLFQVIAQWVGVASGFGDQSMVVEICPDDGSGAPNRNSILYSSTNSPYFVGYISPLAITVSAGTAYHVVFHNPNGLTVNSYACVAGSAGNKLRKSSTGANGSWSDESHGYALANFATYTSSGNTTVTYSGTNIRTVMLDVMSNYNIQGGIISADTTTLDDPGTTMTYTFKSNTVLEAIQKCVDFAPAGWYWYVDVSTNKLHFHKGATVPKHYVTLGKNVMSVQLQKTMETVINSVLVTGGNDGSGFNLFRNYFNTASQGRYGRRTELYNDSNITTTAQALAVATKIITQYKNPTSRAPVTILGHPGDGYNIESIRPGDIFFVQGLQGAVNLQCSRVDYKAYSADLDASTIPPQINNTLEDTQNAVEQQQSNLNPTAPTQVAVA